MTAYICNSELQIENHFAFSDLLIQPVLPVQLQGSVGESWNVWEIGGQVCSGCGYITFSMHYVLRGHD